MAKPFTIARENLVLLLEQIRVKCMKLPQRAQPKGQAQRVPMKSKRPVNVLMHELSIRVAHLHGKLSLPCYYRCSTEAQVDFWATQFGGTPDVRHSQSACNVTCTLPSVATYQNRSHSHTPEGAARCRPWTMLVASIRAGS